MRPSRLDRTDEARQVLGNLVVAETADQRQAAGFVCRVQHDRSARSGRQPVSDGPHFRPIGFLMPRQYSTCAWSGWRVRSPIQIMWPDVAYQSPEVESTRVSACFVAEQQRLVAGEEVGLAQARMVLGRDADRLHEIHGFGDSVGKLAVALAPAGCP